MAQNDFTAIANSTATNAAEVKAASTAATASDPALVVAVSPNNALMPKAVPAGTIKGVTVGVVAGQLDASPPSARKSIAVVSHPENGGIIYVGFSGAVTTSATVATMGWPLAAGQSVAIDLTEGQGVWAIASAAGQIAGIMQISGGAI